MNRLKPVRVINVGLDFGEQAFSVGRLAMFERKIFFEFTPEFLGAGLEISPLNLPLRSGVQQSDSSLFESDTWSAYESMREG